MDAFNTLSLSRSSSFAGPGPIQLSEIKSYLDVYGITGQESVSEFIMFVQVLDLEFLEWIRTKK